jgi:hypothetical protein
LNSAFHIKTITDDIVHRTMNEIVQHYKFQLLRFEAKMS